MLALAQYCRHLRSVDLNQCHSVSDAALSELVRQCTHLEKLVLCEIYHITDVSMASIAMHCNTRLRWLDITHCSKITDASVVALTHSCPNLQVFVCSSTCLTDASIIAIANQCKELNVLQFCRAGGIFTDASIFALTLYSRQLTNLDISSCRGISDDALLALVEACQKLEGLRLYNTGSTLTREALRKVNAFVRLF